MIKANLIAMSLAMFMLAAFSTNAAAKNEADENYIRSMARHDMFEIAFGRLLISNGRSAQVQDFGRTLVRDHSRSLRIFEELARDKRVDLPRGINHDQQRALDLFSRMRGFRFDLAVISFSLSDHMHAIMHAKDVLRLGESGEVKRKAGEDIQRLDRHKDHAVRLLDDLGSRRDRDRDEYIY